MTVGRVVLALAFALVGAVLPLGCRGGGNDGSSGGGSSAGHPGAPPFTVSIAAPKSVDAASGLTISVAGQGGAGALARAEVLVGGALVATLTAPPFQYSFVAPVTAGDLAVAARATDASGSAASAEAHITVRAAAPDAPPSVTLSAPSEAPQGSRISLSAQASADRGLALVRFDVNGTVLSSSTQSQGVYTQTFAVAPGTPPGTTYTFHVLARDSAGLETSAQQVVTVVLANAPAEPPVIDSILVPAMVAPSATFSVIVNASASRGISEVDLGRLDGTTETALAALTAAPFSFSVTAPGAPGTLTLAIHARDAAGNVTSQNASVSVQSAFQPSPPVVTLGAPAEVPAGTTVPLTATVSDPTGIARVIFSQGLSALSVLSAPPYAFSAPLPASAQPGDTIGYLVTARNMAGLETTSSRAVRVVARGMGVVTGEVFSADGAPLAGATVEVLSSGSTSSPSVVAGAASAPSALGPSFTSNENGRFAIPAPAGEVRLRVRAPGRRACYRRTVIDAGAAVGVASARLEQEAASATTISAIAGGTVPATSGAATLVIAPGNVPQDQAMSLSTLSLESLPDLLPRGWSPAAALEVGPPAASLGLGGELRIPNVTALASGDPIVARFDEGSGRWVRIAERVSRSGNDVAATIIAPGVYALVLLDPNPGFAPSRRGAALAEASAARAGTALHADILPSNPIIISSKDAVVDVRAVLTGLDPAPTGTLLRLETRESYTFVDGSALVLPRRTRAVPVLRRAADPQESAGIDGTAHLRLSPEEAFDPGGFAQGEIRITAFEAAAAPPPVPVHASGGAVALPDGTSLTIAAGLLPSSTAIELRALSATALPIPLPASLRAIAGAEVAAYGLSVTVPATLALPAPGEPAGPAVLFEIIDSSSLGGRLQPAPGDHNGRRTRWSAAGDATISNGLASPSVTLHDGAIFVLARAVSGTGIVAGTVRRGTQPVEGAVVTADGGTAASIASRDGAYRLTLAEGPAHIRASLPSTGETAEGSVTIASGQTAALDLALAVPRPQVVSVSPPPGAQGASLATTVILTLNMPADPANFGSGAVALLDPTGNAIPADLKLLPGGLSGVLVPRALLSPLTTYTVRVGAGLLSTSGSAFAPFTSTFTTLSNTPPPQPAAGQIRMSPPDQTGVVTISGTQGATNPGTAVIALDDSTGSTTTVLSDSNGSFSIGMTASPGEHVTLVMRDPSGQETRFSPGVFDDGRGTAIVTVQGGTMYAPDGAQISIDPGSVDAPVAIHYEPQSKTQTPIQIPPSWTETFGLTFTAAFSLTPSRPVELKHPLRLRIPPSAGTYHEGDPILVCQLANVSISADPPLLVVDVGHVHNGAVEDPGIVDLLNPGYYALIYASLYAGSFAEVTGRALTAPRYGAVHLTVPSEALRVATTLHLVAAAVPGAPGITVQSLTLLRADGSIVTSRASEGVLEAYEPVDRSLVSYVHIVDGRDVRPAFQQWWVAVAQFKTPDGVVIAQAIASTRIVAFANQVTGGTREDVGYPEGFLVKRDQYGKAIVDQLFFPSHLDAGRFGRAVTDAAVRPLPNVLLQLDNGIGAGFPAATRTNASGEFLLGLANLGGVESGLTTPHSLRIIDPATGHFTRIPIQLGAGMVTLGDIFVPKSFGDTEPPVLNVEVTGRLVVGNSVGIRLIARDNDRLNSVTLEIDDGPKQTFSASGSTFDTSVPFTPVSAGVLRLVAVATDAKGNLTTRKLEVKVSEPATPSGSVVAGGAVTLSQGSQDVDPNVGIYVQVSGSAPPGTDIKSIPYFVARFVDPSTGATFPAIGSVTSDGQHIRIRPERPLPLNTDLVLEITGLAPIHFTTGGLARVQALTGSSEILGIAVGNGFAYVADIGDGSIKIVQITGTARFIGTPLGFPAGPRALALSLSDPALTAALPQGVRDVLVVVGGGAGVATASTSLPILRIYDVTHPPVELTDTPPAVLGTAILGATPDEGTPVTVRLQGRNAYVCMAGAGLQVVDLAAVLKREQALSIGARIASLSDRGETAITGGFRLPDPTPDLDANGQPWPAGAPRLPPFFRPLLGTAFDVALGLRGLAPIGGASTRLYVLSNPGLSLIPNHEPSDVSSSFALGQGISRLLGSGDFITSAIDAAGNDTFRNMQLLAVSHGSVGGISLVDLSDPSQPLHLGTVPDAAMPGSTVQQMELVSGYIFTGERLVSVLDPVHPVASKVLEGTIATPGGLQRRVRLSAGGAVAVDRSSLAAIWNRIQAMSSSADRATLQIADIRLPRNGRDWNIIRTTQYEPRIAPDNQEYLNLGDPVNPFTGEFVMPETDLAIPGRGLNFEFTRTYRSQIEYDGPLGQGWDFNYDERLTFDPEHSRVVHFDGAGRTSVFSATSGSAATYNSPRGEFSELRRADDASGDLLSRQFILEDPAGTKRTFEPSFENPFAHFRLASIEDRRGNRMSFSYKTSVGFAGDRSGLRDQLASIRDSMGRDITLSYDFQGRLVLLRDFIGRTIRYRYDSDDNLTAVTKPPRPSVTTPPAGGFPDGLTTRYSYTAGFQEEAWDGAEAEENPKESERVFLNKLSADGTLLESLAAGHVSLPVQHHRLPTARLNHNLISVTDPKGITYLRLTYYDARNDTWDPSDVNFDRVRYQQLGVAPDGGRYEYRYKRDPQSPVAAPRCNQAITTNRTGHRTTRVYTATGEVDHVDEDVTIDGATRTITGRMTYTSEGLVETSTTPRGIVVRNVYDESNPKRTRQADLVTVEVTPVGTGTPRVTTYRYGPYGIATHVIDPLGNDTATAVDPLGNIRAITHPAVAGQPAVVDRFTYKPCGLIESQTSANGSITTYTYSTAPDGGTGYLAAIVVDAASGGTGETPRVAADSPARLVTTQVPDAVGNVISTRDARGLTTTFKVNTHNQIEEVSDPRGTRVFRFDANDNLETIDERGLGGAVVTRAFDSLNLLRSVAQADAMPARSSRSTVMGYTANEEPLFSRSPLGHETWTTLDERSLPVRVRTQVGPRDPRAVGTTGPEVREDVIASFYNEDGKLTRTTAPPGSSGQGSTRYEYNGFDEVSVVTDANGDRTEMDYDARGLVVEERRKDAQGRLLRLVHTNRDALGRASRVIAPTFLGPDQRSGEQSVTRFEFDAMSRVRRAIDSLGRTRFWEYDGLGRAVHEVDADGNESFSTYADNNGVDLSSLTTVEIERDHSTGVTVTSTITTTTNFVHDVYGRLRFRRGPLGHATEFRYDNRNLVRFAVTSITVSALPDVVENRYDVFGRRTALIHGATAMANAGFGVGAGGTMELFEYDDEDRLTCHKFGEGGGSLAMAYDARSRLRSLTYADGKYELMDYYPDNMLRTRQDRAGNSFEYAYDLGQRLRSVDVTPQPGFEGIVRRTLDYDGLNRVVTASVTDAGGQRSEDRLRLDSRGATLEDAEPAGTVSSSYDVVGQRATLSYPASASTLSFDHTPLGLIRELRRGAGVLTQIDFSGPRRQLGARFGNGTSAKRTFNAAREEVERRFVDPSRNAVTRFVYARDARGRITGVERYAPSSSTGAAPHGDAFEYTPEDWLATARLDLERPLDPGVAQGQATTLESFAYDARGNRTSRSENGVVQSFVPNALNQYTSVGTSALTYDNNGNLRSDGRFTFGYDALNQLRRVADATGVEIVRYDYDALGRRIREIRPSGAEQYVYDGANIVSVLDGSGNLIREYVHGDLVDRPISLRIGQAEYFYQHDGMGSVVALTDGQGQVVERYRYDPFGHATILAPDGATARARSAIGNRRMFMGLYRDPDTGLVCMRAREYSPDLGRFLQMDPASAAGGLNLYAYAGNDPINWSDPTGLYRQASFENHGLHRLGESAMLGGDTFNDLLMVDGLARLGIAVGKAVVELPATLRMLKTNAGTAPSFARAGSIALKLENSARIERGWAVRSALSDLRGEARLGARAMSAPTAALLPAGDEPIFRGEARSSLPAGDEPIFPGEARSPLPAQDEDVFWDPITFPQEREGVYLMCFVAGTRVVVEGGTAPIETVARGDRVLSRDEHTGEQDYRPVLETYVTHPTTIFHIRYRALAPASEGDDGAASAQVSGELCRASAAHRPQGGRDVDGEIISTGEHPFWSLSRGRWVLAKHLKAGERLSSADGTPCVVADVTAEYATEGTSFTTYNLQVEALHTYFVLPRGAIRGPPALWVHNNGPQCPVSHPYYAASPSGEVVMSREQIQGVYDMLVSDSTKIAVGRLKEAKSASDVMDVVRDLQAEGRVAVMDRTEWLEEFGSFDRGNPGRAFERNGRSYRVFLHESLVEALDSATSATQLEYAIGNIRFEIAHELHFQDLFNYMGDREFTPTVNVVYENTMSGAGSPFNYEAYLNKHFDVVGLGGKFVSFESGENGLIPVK